MSTLPEHRADAVAKVSGKRGKRYLMREHILEVGGSALDELTEIMHRRLGAWLGEVEQLHALLQQHGASLLRMRSTAAARARPRCRVRSHYLPDPQPASRQGVLPI